MNIATIISFVFFTVLVAAIAYYKTIFKTRAQRQKSVNEYFLAGGSLTCWVIAGSMLLGNLSGEQLVGLNGSAYATNLSAAAWETTAGLAAIVLALYLLPRYLKGGFTTTPQFLEQRFDAGVKQMVSGLFAGGYILFVIPGTLYIGAIAFNNVFGLEKTLGYSREMMLCILILSIGIISSLYAILGGMRLASVANTLNAIGLLVAGLTVLFLGLHAIGKGNIFDGIMQLRQNFPEKLNTVSDGRNGTLPIGGVVTGVLFANMFYWATNQVIIQRCLSAKSLAEGQKGALLTGLFKMLGPLIMMIPGIIAYHYYIGGIADPALIPKQSDFAYPSLVRDLLPWWMVGFFMAALFGSILSVCNSLMTAGTTLITLDFIKPRFPNMSDEATIKTSKYLGMVIAVVTMGLAMFFLFAPDGIYAIMRRFAGFYNISTITVFTMGFLTRRVPAFAAKISICFHVITYTLLIFVLKIESPDSWAFGVLKNLFGDNLNIHFTYIMGALFFVEIGLMLLISVFKPVPKAEYYVAKELPPSERFNDWKFARGASVLMGAFFIFLYMTFSSFGIATPEPVSSQYFVSVSVLWAVALVLAFILTPKNKSH